MKNLEFRITKMKEKVAGVVLYSIFYILYSASPALAAATEKWGSLTDDKATGLASQANLSDPGGTVEKLMSNIVGFLTLGAILWFVIMIIIGAYGWISAGGDAKAVEAAQKRISNSIVGLVVVFISLAFLTVLGYLLGVKVLGVGDFIRNLSIYGDK